jgi:phosphatidylinositol-3-phosphatase
LHPFESYNRTSHEEVDLKGLRFPFISFYIFFLVTLHAAPKSPRWSTRLPVYSHVVIVIEENKDYDEIIGNANAPYINKLASEGANFTRMFAEEHNSEGNYFWLFSGSNHNVGFHDKIPTRMISAKKLAVELIRKGLSFRGYSEGLPAIGSAVDTAYPYARKHVPWVTFSNLPGGNDPRTSVNLQFTQFPTDFDSLPTVAIVIPNLIDDMHDRPYPENVRNGDTWLKNTIDPYYQWAKTHNSLLIITFDESENHHAYHGLTNPANKDKSMQNRIPTIFAGAHIRHGDYEEGKGITHVSILHTLEAMYRLPFTGHQSKAAEQYGIKESSVITDVFEPAH